MSHIEVASAVETTPGNFNVVLQYDEGRQFTERVENVGNAEEAIDVAAQRVWGRYHAHVFRDGERVAVSG